jgi:hypothetical protein
VVTRAAIKLRRAPVIGRRTAMRVDVTVNGD